MKSILGLVLLIASIFAQHAPTQNMFTPDQIQYSQCLRSSLLVRN
jgi:hypothetical protein